MLEDIDIFITGGAGTFGKAFARRRKKAGWTGRLTVYSSDSHKHEAMAREYPDINFVQGDIRNSETLFHAMVGHDLVIHAAATKIIPISEVYSLDTMDVNINGSQCVCETATRAKINTVIGISTDKSCHAVNAYGASKYLMEKIFAEYSRVGYDTEFLLVRLGNVLESNGSVVQFWHQAIERGDKIKITDPGMTRFWLSPAQAVQKLLDCLHFTTSGNIYIPRLPGLSIGKLAEYIVGKTAVEEAEIIEIRPGEKRHEELLTVEECHYTDRFEDHYILRPTTSKRTQYPNFMPFTSDIAPELTKDELIELLKND